MPAVDVKQLLLQVDASVELLRRNLSAGDAAVAKFAANTQRRLDATDRRFAQFGKPLNGIAATVARTNAQIATLGNSMQSVERRMLASSGAIKAALLGSTAGIAAAFSLDKIRQFADGYTRFTNQLKVAGVEQSQIGRTQEDLFGIAQRYGVELESIGTLYGRATQAGKALGASQSDILRFTNGVGAALKIQGGSAESSAGALLQLSQLLGTGTVRAEEFNSVNEGARPILQAVANGISKYAGSVSALRNDVIEGKVTSQDFFQGFLRGSAQLEAQAAKANLTIGASFTILNNALGRYIGQTDEALSLTARLSGGIVGLANNLDTIIPALAGIAVGFAAMKAGSAAFGGLTAIIATATAADQELAAQVLRGNASFVDRAGLAAKSALAAQEAAAAEVLAIEATIAARREEAVQLEANLALIERQRNAARLVSAVGADAGLPGLARTGQNDANAALKAQITTKRALTAVNEEIAVSEAALGAAQVRAAAATVAATEATAAATVGAKVAAGATAILTGALNLLTAALPIIAIGALTAGIIYFASALNSAEADAKAITDQTRELAERAAAAATQGRNAASAITQVGAEAAANTGKVLIFAGAVGDAAQKLRELAVERKKKAVDDAQEQVTIAETNRKNQSTNTLVMKAKEAFDVAFIGPEATTGSRAASAAAQAKLDEANRNLATARRQLAAASGTKPESYILPSDRTGQRDLKGELDRINADLLVARKRGNREEINDLSAQAYERKRTIALMKEGSSFEAASAQASREASAQRSAGQEKISADASKKAGREAAAGRRKEAALVVDAANDTRAYKAAERQANDTIAAANADLTNSAVARAQIERDRVEADRQSKNEEIAQQGIAGRYTAERVAALQALNDRAAKAQTAVIDLREQQRVQQDATDLAIHGLEVQREIVGEQGNLATTAAARRLAELRLLDLQEQEETLRLRRILAFNSGASESERGQALIDLNTQDARFGARRASVLANTRGPAETYLASLNARDINEQLEQVKVNGLNSLEDGLVDLVTSTKSVKAAFKDMATSIIADLARIAIQKYVVSAISTSVFGFAEGGLPRFADGGLPPGLITGPGGPRSDSIVARVSNREFIVNADATARHLPLLEAINRNRLPAFADGGPVSPIAAFAPARPNLAAIAKQRQESRTHVETTLSVRASPLLEATVEQTAIRTVGAAAEPIMAGAQVRTMKAMGRRSLPGGYGG